MSYRQSVMDSSRATPYFYQRKNPPVKTHRSSYFNLARDAVITRKFGQYKPFWAKALDSKVSKFIWKNKRYIPFIPWFAKYDSELQKTIELRNGVKYGTYRGRYSPRSRGKSSRTDKRHRCTSACWRKNHRLSTPARLRKCRCYKRKYSAKRPVSSKRTRKRKSFKRRY